MARFRFAKELLSVLGRRKHQDTCSLTSGARIRFRSLLGILTRQVLMFTVRVRRRLRQGFPSLGRDAALSITPLARSVGIMVGVLVSLLVSVTLFGLAS